MLGNYSEYCPESTKEFIKKYGCSIKEFIQIRNQLPETLNTLKG